MNEVRIKPQPGPQTAFLGSTADVAVIGGAAGGTKSYSLLLEAGRHYEKPGYEGILFRRTKPQLRGGRGLWAESKGIYRHLGGVSRESPSMDWRFPSGAHIEMTHLETEAAVYAHDGRQYAFIGFDEMQHFTAFQFWYLFSRMRSMTSIRPYFRGTCNPDPRSFVAGLVAWYIDEEGYAIPERSGVIRWFARINDEIQWADSRTELLTRYPDELPMSFTFIPAKLSDNPILLAADPTYEAKLRMLPWVERMRLLEGNWKVGPSAGTLFRREWFGYVDTAPEIVARGRFWDLAATEPTPANPEPAYTEGTLMSITRAGHVYIEDCSSLRKGPGGVKQHVRATAELDGEQVMVVIWRDPGQAGKAQEEEYGALLRGVKFEAVIASKDKVTYSYALSAKADPDGPGGAQVSLVRGEWNRAWVQQHEDFPDGKFKDKVDSSSLGCLILKRHESAAPLEDIKLPVDGYHDGGWSGIYG